MTRIRGLRPFRRAAAWEDRFWRVLEGTVPHEVRAHLRNARQEILLAVKAVVDETVARSEGRAAKPPARKPKSS